MCALKSRSYDILIAFTILRGTLFAFKMCFAGVSFPGGYAAMPRGIFGMPRCRMPHGNIAKQHEGGYGSYNV